jgi:hypothetical protein
MKPSKPTECSGRARSRIALAGTPQFTLTIRSLRIEPRIIDTRLNAPH